MTSWKAGHPRLLLSAITLIAAVMHISNGTSLGVIPVESFPSDNPNFPNPNGKLGSGQSFSKTILDRHNYYREAVNLEPLKWNSTLAKLAYMTSKFFREQNCTEDHRFAFNKKHWVGENIYSMSRYPLFAEDESVIEFHANFSVDLWYREIRVYMYNMTDGATLRDCLPHDQFGSYAHFLQMMWQKGRQLGCSYASCLEEPLPGIEMPKIIVNCYYDTPILIGTQAFSKWIANKLDAWEGNKELGGLRTCE